MNVLFQVLFIRTNSGVHVGSMRLPLLILLDVKQDDIDKNYETENTDNLGLSTDQKCQDYQVRLQVFGLFSISPSFPETNK